MSLETEATETRTEPIDQHIFVRGILSSLTAALQLVVEAREHHALCLRSISMIVVYEKDWPLFHMSKWDDYPDDRRAVLAKWYQWIKLTAESASKQNDLQYKDVLQRSVVLLSDILENLTESFLQVCLQYIHPRVVDIRRITGRRPRNILDPTDVRRCVRAWERNLQDTSRLNRFTRMIKLFFPAFDYPMEKRRNLDSLLEERNLLTHELIVISRHDFENTGNVHVDDPKVQSYFDDLGDYILALMDAFKNTVTDGIPSRVDVDNDGR